MKYELVIYAGGTAILADDEGETLWTSDADDDFAAEFDGALSFEDGDDIAAWLDDNGYLPDGVGLDIVESDDTGLREILSGEAGDDDYEDDDYEDDERAGLDA